jgi:general secretion pathway protein D
MRNLRFILGLATIAATIVATQAQIGGGGGARTGGAGGASGNGTRQYLNNTMIGDALIEVDPETRTIIVITDDETNTNIGNVIKALDKPKPQVLINVVFMEITHDNSSDIGIDGKFSYSQSGGRANTGSNFGIPGLDAATAAFAGSGGLYSLTAGDYEINFAALAEQGKLEVLSRPTILARNNQEAVITVGQEVPFIRNTQILQNGQQFNTVEYEDIGIILRVTPFITSDGLVEMIVSPEISTITGQTIPISEGVDAPVFAKRSAETVVVTPDGQTVVIGGLIEDNKTETIRKIPFLGDIPLLGAAFRRKETADTKTELLILLTPNIVNRPSELLRASQNEMERVSMTREAFPEQEFNKPVRDMSDEELERYIDSLKTRLDSKSEE